MENKKQQNLRLMKIGLTTLVFVSGVGLTMSNMMPTMTFATEESADALTKETQVINTDSVWKYLDNNVDPANGDVSKASDWTKQDFNDSEWKSSKGTFGAKKGKLDDLGGGLIPSVLLNQYYDEAGTKDIPTYFFRSTFQVENVAHVKGLLGTLKADDGVIVYINGVNVLDAYMKKNEVVSEPNMYYAGENGGSPKAIDINLDSTKIAGLLQNGSNTIAVELHNDRETSSDIYFEMSDLRLSYEAETLIQKAVSLTVGKDETQNNLTWYANTSETGSVQVAKKSNVVNNVFPTVFKTYSATSKKTADGNFYSNQATLDNLEGNTAYVYRIINGETISDTFSFTTGNYDGNFRFLLAGDPQIGSSGSVEVDSKNWNDTLNKAMNAFNPNFLITAGDQVNVAANENEYTGYLSAGGLSNLPSATTIGNHDTSSNAYQDHFNLPNEDASKGATTAGSDYWFVYNNTLFMDINTNNKSIAEHKAFMQDAIAKNPDVRWKSVIFHHSVYSTASHTNDSEIINLRNALPPIFSELDIDVVLQGHDHVYTRTYMMNGLVADQSNGVQSSVLDPTGVLYLTANSASGSKYYDIKAPDAAFAAKMDQSKRRTITDVSVSDNSFTLTTYYTDDMSVLDTFTINKTAQTNESEEIFTPSNGEGASIDVSVKVGAGSVEKGANLNLQEITTGDLFAKVNNAIKQQLGSEKTFVLLSMAFMKNNATIDLKGNAEISFAIPEGYEADNLKIYRYEDQSEKRNRSEAIQTGLETIDYEIKEKTIIVKAKELGNFVIVNNSNPEQDDNNGGNPDTTPSEKPTDKPSDDATITPVEKPTDNGIGNADSVNSSVKTSDATSLTAFIFLCILGVGSGLIAFIKKMKLKE